MNNALRAWVQRRFEAPWLFRGLSLPPGARCLEIGCGRGVGALLVARQFSPSLVLASDVDPQMIGEARRYLKGKDGVIQLLVADGSSLPFADGAFDACFNFGVLHHIPDWERALREIARVLRPGGLFVGEEPHLYPPLTLLFPFTLPRRKRFLEGLEGVGLEVLSRWSAGHMGLLFQARKKAL